MPKIIFIDINLREDEPDRCLDCPPMPLRLLTGTSWPTVPTHLPDDRHDHAMPATSTRTGWRSCLPPPDLNQQGIVTAVSIIFPASTTATMLQCQVTPSRCRYGCLRGHHGRLCHLTYRMTATTTQCPPRRHEPAGGHAYHPPT